MAVRADLGPAADARADAPVIGQVKALGPHGDDAAGAIESWRARAPHDTLRPTWHPLLPGYQWPIDHARITNAFGPGRPGSFLVDGRTMHDGIDLATFCGDLVVAAHDGVVLVAGRHHEGFVGWVGDLTAFRAKLDASDAWSRQAIGVVVDDGNGYRSIYLHLGRAVVRAGEVVRAGDLLGYEGSTGNSSGCHLHYALFNPSEKETLTLDPKVVARNLLPPLEIARIDPLLVLPPLSWASITWGWGARDG